MATAPSTGFLRCIRSMERRRSPRYTTYPQLLLLEETKLTPNSSGDKDNHIATLHIAQMLYIWPFILFFSWPVILLPQLSTLLTNTLSLQQLRNRLPRPAITISILLLMGAIVHYNTIVHPFTLADNRHYTFYVFRILTRYSPLVKYGAVPVYFVCAWLVLNAIGGSGQKEDAVRVSFVLVWLISTILSLVTAPLVEPRYFIVPWLIWRLHLPEIATSQSTNR